MYTRIITMLLVCAATVASAEIGTVAVTRDGTVVHSAGKVLEGAAISTNATGTAEIKAVREIWGEADDVRTTYMTNYTWTAICEGGAVTNTTAYYPKDWLYWIGTNYVSFATNAVVTTVSVTNKVPRLLFASTNTVASITCAGGVGSDAPETPVFVLPGDRLIYTGTAAGRVDLVIEK